MSLKIFFAALIVLLFLSASSFGFELQSVYYKISGDINSGSGNLSSSNYKITSYAIGTISNESISASYKIILGISMPEFNDTFAATCISNTTSCISKQYGLSGWIMTSEGSVVDNGNLKITVKETGDVYETTFSGGYFSVYPQFCLVPGNIYNFIVQSETEGKTATINFKRIGKVSDVNVTCTTGQTSCSFKVYPISGWAFDSNTGSLIESGTIRITVKETGDVYETTFSGGYFSVYPQFCLTNGGMYTFILAIEGGDKQGFITYRKPGIG